MSIEGSSKNIEVSNVITGDSNVRIEENIASIRIWVTEGRDTSIEVKMQVQVIVMWV